MNSTEIVRICKALGDANRIEIVGLLQESSLNATELLDKLQISQPTLSHHMKLLKESNVVKSRKEGTTTVYSLNEVAFKILGEFGSAASIDSPAFEEVTEAESNYQNKLLDMVKEAKLENNAKSEFIQKMSYDLRSPIQSIRGMVLLAKKNSDDKEKFFVALEKLDEAAGQLENKLDEILDLSQLEEEKESITLSPFNIFDNAREINSIYVPAAEKNNISFSSEVEGEIKHPYVLSNRIYIKRVFQLILDNAMDAVSKNGSIGVTFREVNASADVAVHEIVICDSASDVDYEERLCFSVVDRLLRKAQGKLNLEKTLEGNRVTVKLPLVIDQQAEKNCKDKSDSDIHGKRILLVEDNEINREVAEFILSDAGATVVCAEDGQQAVDIIKNSAEGEFSMILMDIVMPNLDGYEATRQIRSLNRADVSKVPIIAMSANAFDKDIRMSMDAGMNEHISKPLSVGKIMQVLNRWLTV